MGGGRTFSLPDVVNNSLRRRLRGFSFTGRGVVSSVGDEGVAMGVRLVVGMGRESLRGRVGGGGFREESETRMSSVMRSSASESEASVSDMTRGDPTNGASRLGSIIFYKRVYLDVRAFCLFFLSSLNWSNFKSIRRRSLTVFLVPLEPTLLMSVLCPSRAEINPR